MRAGRVYSNLMTITYGLLACGKVDDTTDSTHLPPGAEASGGGAGAPSAGAGTSAGGSSGGENGSGAGASGGSGAASPSPGTGGSSLDSEDVPIELFERPTVWIGEVESAVTYPNVHEDHSSPERVILILDAMRSSVTGTLTFGEGPLPAPDPLEIYPTWTGPDGTWPTYPENWDYSPFPGFPYAIVSSDLRDNRLSINFATREVWAEWCKAHSGGQWCTCDGGTCEASSEPVRRLELVVTGDTMAGQISRPAGNWLGGVPAIRLLRVQ
jgi:hypothetical protein